MGATQIMVHDDDLMGAVETAFANQRRFDEAADLCWHLAVIGPRLNEPRSRLTDLSETWAARVHELMSSARSDLTELRIAVLRFRDARAP